MSTRACIALHACRYAKIKSILPRYYAHMWRHRNKSLLPRFYGAYSITIQAHEKHFVVMESVFRNAPGLKVHMAYDLKGSWVDRHAGVGAAQSGGTLKDMDMITPMRLSKSEASATLRQLKADCELLRSSNLMDYSLLLGVHNQAVDVRVFASSFQSTASADALVAQQVDAAWNAPSTRTPCMPSPAHLSCVWHVHCMCRSTSRSTTWA